MTTRIPCKLCGSWSKGEGVPTLLAGQADCLWDDALTVEVKELPADLAALDVFGPLPDRALTVR